MPWFLVEAYFPDRARVDLGAAVKRARRVAQEMSGGGVPIRHLRSILVPDDEVCFHLFESPTIEAVCEVGVRAELSFNRVTEAFEPVLTV